MKKKILAALTAACLFVGTAVPVFAADNTPEPWKVYEGGSVTAESDGSYVLKPSTTETKGQYYGPYVKFDGEGANPINICDGFEMSAELDLKNLPAVDANNSHIAEWSFGVSGNEVTGRLAEVVYSFQKVNDTYTWYYFDGQNYTRIADVDGSIARLKVRFLPDNDGKLVAEAYMDDQLGKTYTEFFAMTKQQSDEKNETREVSYSEVAGPRYAWLCNSTATAGILSNLPTVTSLAKVENPWLGDGSAKALSENEYLLKSSTIAELNKSHSGPHMMFQTVGQSSIGYKATVSVDLSTVGNGEVFGWAFGVNEKGKNTILDDAVCQFIGTGNSTVKLNYIDDMAPGATSPAEDTYSDTLTVTAEIFKDSDEQASFKLTWGNENGNSVYTYKLRTEANSSWEPVDFTKVGVPRYIWLWNSTVKQGVKVNRPAFLAANTITVNTPANGSLRTAPADTAFTGDTVEVTASADPGYELESLTYTPAGGTPVDIKSVQTFKMPDKAVTIDATFQNTFIPVKDITGVPTDATAGTALPLTYALTPSNATNKQVTWSVTDAGTTKASISGNKSFNALEAGTATITATVVNGTAKGRDFTKAFDIKVTKPEPNTYTVTADTNIKDTLRLTIGDSATLNAAVTPPDASDKTVTWKSSNDAIVTVAEGKLTAIKEGHATITVTTNDGNKTAECSITVTKPITPPTPEDPVIPDTPIETPIIPPTEKDPVEVDFSSQGADLTVTIPAGVTEAKDESGKAISLANTALVLTGRSQDEDTQEKVSSAINDKTATIKDIFELILKDITNNTEIKNPKFTKPLQIVTPAAYNTGKRYAIYSSQDGTHFTFHSWARNVGGKVAFSTTHFTYYANVEMDKTAPSPTHGSWGGSGNTSFNGYIITAEAGPNGTISPDGDSKVDYGDSLTITVTPNDGYTVDKVLVDGKNEVSLTNGTYTFVDITEPYTIKATFKKSAATTEGTAEAPAPAPSVPAPNPATGDSWFTHLFDFFN